MVRKITLHPTTPGLNPIDICSYTHTLHPTTTWSKPNSHTHTHQLGLDQVVMGEYVICLLYSIVMY